MTFTIDRTAEWTDHYVEHGFVHLKGVVATEFTEPALQEAIQLVGNGLPPEKWTTHNAPKRSPVPMDQTSVLPAVYDQPNIRFLIDTMFGSPELWTGERNFQLFISPYDEDAQPLLRSVGHIDFVNCPVPTLGSGFMFQVALAKSEPFGGNITIHPGTQKSIQRAVAQNPDLQYPKDLSTLLHAPPYEFVADPGDVLVFHHLVGHGSNPNHAANRSPRINLHCQALRKAWLKQIDPDEPGLSPWERSLAYAGKYRPRDDEERVMTDYYRRKQQQRETAAATMS